MSPVRVLVVDDSVTMRHLLRVALSGLPELEVVGAASSGELALAKVAQERPDVVTLDLEMPGLDGLEVLRRLQADYPEVCVIVVSALTKLGAEATLNALAAGAADYVTKPSRSTAHEGLAALQAELVPKIISLVGRAGRALEVTPAPPAPRPSRIEAVVIGASTGGPPALTQLLQALPADLPVPVMIVQHMPKLFTARFAERLDLQCPLRVHEVTSTVSPRPGEVWLAPGDRHLVVGRGVERELRLRLHDGPPLHSCRPAADELFRSAASCFGQGVLGVVLTGMGCDGLAGSRSIVEVGGRVIVQDEASSVVWGMPGHVAQAGLAERVLPLDQIAGAVREIVRERS